MDRKHHSACAFGIATETERLSRDQAFEASDRLKSLLRYLGRRTAEGDRVTQTEIAMDVMDLSPDFDPQVDAHVRIEVGRLRKALELHYARAGNAETARIAIPKGSYRPELQTAAPLAPHLAPEGETRATIFTGLVCSPDLSHDLAELVARELRVHCFASPLSGVARFPVRVAETPADWEKLAREERADLALHVTGYRTEAEYRVLIDVSNPGTAEILHSQRQVFSAATGQPRLAQKIARSSANTLCDPILGTVPALAVRQFGDRTLQVLLSAYRFMATQRIEAVPEVLTALEHLAKSADAAASIKALHAELVRVNSWVSGRNPRDDALRCLEMAEDAIAEDPNDLTCRIALAYNRLNAGLIEAALHTGTVALSNPAPSSLTHMSRLLVALSDTEGRHKDLLVSSDLEDETPFFMREFAQIIPMIRWSEVHEAERRLANSLFPNIFWLHVFHAAVLAEMGNLKLAAQSADRIRQRLPNYQVSLRRMIEGFFPQENEHTYLLRGLHQSGLRLS